MVAVFALARRFRETGRQIKLCCQRAAALALSPKAELAFAFAFPAVLTKLLVEPDSKTFTWPSGKRAAERPSGSKLPRPAVVLQPESQMEPTTTTTKTTKTSKLAAGAAKLARQFVCWPNSSTQLEPQRRKTQTQTESFAAPGAARLGQANVIEITMAERERPSDNDDVAGRSVGRSAARLGATSAASLPNRATGRCRE